MRARFSWTTSTGRGTLDRAQAGRDSHARVLAVDPTSKELAFEGDSATRDSGMWGAGVDKQAKAPLQVVARPASQVEVLQHFEPTPEDTPRRLGTKAGEASYSVAAFLFLDILRSRACEKGGLTSRITLLPVASSGRLRFKRIVSLAGDTLYGSVPPGTEEDSRGWMFWVTGPSALPSANNLLTAGGGVVTRSHSDSDPDVACEVFRSGDAAEPPLDTVMAQLIPNA